MFFLKVRTFDQAYLFHINYSNDLYYNSIKYINFSHNIKKSYDRGVIHFFWFQNEKNALSLIAASKEYQLYCASGVVRV